MKKMMLLLLIPWLLAGCSLFRDKDNDDEDTELQVGTFECYVNGVKWTPGPCITSPCLTADNSKKANLRIFAVNTKPEVIQSIDLYLINEFEGLGSYTLNDSTKRFGLFADAHCSNEYIYANSGILNIEEYDPESRIVSGNFEMIFHAPCGEINITNGKFKLRF